MRRAAAGFGAVGLMLATFASPASAATHPAPAVMRGDCFDGPFAHRHALPGASCASGFWCLPGANPELPSIWCLAKRREHHIDVVVLDDRHVVTVNWLNIVLVGYVNDGRGGHYWPFNPLLDRHFCQVPRAHGHHVCAPVLEFQWTGGDNTLRHPWCLQDMATSPAKPALWVQACSPLGQGKADRHSTFMVWAGEGESVPESWQRIVGVRVTNKNALHGGFICLTAPIPFEQHSVLTWIDAIDRLQFVQTWLLGGP